jgi:hypothetical protein
VELEAEINCNLGHQLSYKKIIRSSIIYRGMVIGRAFTTSCNLTPGCERHEL